MIKIIITNFFLAFALSVFIVDSAPEQDNCGGERSYVPFANITEGLMYYSRCTIPTQNLNESCLLSSCPTLNDACPFTHNKSINQSALTSTVTALNKCIGQSGLICGINMSHIPMVQICWNTSQFIPPKVASGNIQFNFGTAYIDHISGAKFSVINADESIITLSIQAPNIVGYGSLNTTFVIPQISFLKSVRQLVPSSLNTPDVKFLGTFNVSVTISVYLSTLTPTIQTLEDSSVIELIHSNFVTDSGIDLDETIVNLFNRGMNFYAKTSVLPSVVNNFLSTYAALGFRAAQLNCP